MKVGILSIYDNENLGNKLQNYALQQTLLYYADDVLTIKNKMSLPSLLERIKRQSPLAESVTANRLMGKHRKAKILRFDQQYIHTSRRAYWYNKGVQRLKSGDCCDIYCAGSDQVWNPDLERADMFNFLGFAQPEQTFSYAASFGVDSIPTECQQTVREGLRHMRHISVREDAGKSIVLDLTGRMDAVVLPDPTLLLSARDWDQVASEPKQKLPEKYILSFFLGEMSEERRVEIENKAYKLDCKVIELMDKNSPFYTCGPDEFLYMIRQARFVCTDSFHASVFSFLYGRPLAIFSRLGSGSNMGSRLATLCTKFSLEERLVQGDDLAPVPDEADYSAGWAALEQERQRARDYLNEVFQQAKEAELCD